MRSAPFAIATAILLASCGNEPTSGLERVRRAGVLRWGGDVQGGEPYAFEDPQRPGTLVGFEVELADAIARELGVRAEFVQQDWTNLVPALERGTFDVVLNGFDVTPAHAGATRLTRPYFIFSARLVARRDDRSVTSLASLRGRRVGTLGMSFAELLREAGVEHVAYEGVEEPYLDLEQGRVDAVLLDDIIAARYGLSRPRLRFVADVADGYYAAATTKRDEDLAIAIDHALARITRRGELRRILARWNIDSERQARLERWSDDDTRAMVLVQEQATFTWHHAQLFAEGAGVTIAISVLAMLIAIPFGLFLALTRMYGPLVFSRAATVYIELFRGTPVLLQLYSIYFGIVPWVRDLLGLHAMTAWDAPICAVVGLGLNYAAYEAEIHRSGIQAIPPGQIEAARVLGMSRRLAIRRVIVPQSVRIALPGMTNDFIAMLKDSSLVSVITVVELTKRMTITAVDVRGWLVPGVLCAVLYLAMSYPLARVAGVLEARLAREGEAV